jgi:hypothetical protein
VTGNVVEIIVSRLSKVPLCGPVGEAVFQAFQGNTQKNEIAKYIPFNGGGNWPIVTKISHQ